MEGVDGGQPAVWAEVVAKGDRITTRRETVEPISINTPNNDTDTELDNMVIKWI